MTTKPKTSKPSRTSTPKHGGILRSKETGEFVVVGAVEHLDKNDKPVAATDQATVHTGFDAPFFDEEERELVEGWERALGAGEIVPDKTREEAQAEWQEIVRNTLRKKPVTVRLQQQDISRIKVMALERGIPYQTLLSSIIHQYANGMLKEKS